MLEFSTKCTTREVEEDGVGDNHVKMNGPLEGPGC